MKTLEVLQQFLEQEEELLSDFLLDMEDAEDNRNYSKAVAMWSMQTTRVSAIKDAIALLEG